MKAYKMEALKRAVLIVLISAMVVTPSSVRAGQAAAKGATQPAQAVDKVDDDDTDQAQKLEEAKARERERQEKEREKIQEQQEREQERQQREREHAVRMYEKATKALDKRQYEDAVKLFDELIQKGGDRVEGAYYWKAYGEFKHGQFKEALATYEALVKAFPQSRWMNDAKQLAVEIQQAEGRPLKPEDQADEELQLLALNGLMHADPQRAWPLLQKLLESSRPLKIKEQALFVLSQSGSDKAREVLANFARGQANPDLQLKSLEYLALFGGKESRQTLEEVYKSSDDKTIKRSILGFFMIGGDRDRLLAAAKGEKDADLRGEAIGQLGVLGARDELSEMYQESEVKVKRKILDALFVGGAADKMIDLAQNEKDPELRRVAIEKLGLMGSQKTADTLVKMYANENDKNIRKKVIEALFMQGNAKAIVEIARKETDPELKKKAVEQLSIMNSKEGAEFFEEILNK